MQKYILLGRTRQQELSQIAKRLIAKFMVRKSGKKLINTACTYPNK